MSIDIRHNLDLIIENDNLACIEFREGIIHYVYIKHSDFSMF